MCVVAIVDTDSISVLVSKRSPGDDLFLSWIRSRHGLLAIPTSGKYFTEVRKNKLLMELLGRYEQGGQLRKISTDELVAADIQMEHHKKQKTLRSNDPHILSLALASNARVLCSGDGDLCSDFKDKKILPPMGRRQRVLYPIEYSRRIRREFLNRQRCANK